MRHFARLGFLVLAGAFLPACELPNDGGRKDIPADCVPGTPQPACCHGENGGPSPGTVRNAICQIDGCGVIQDYQECPTAFCNDTASGPVCSEACTPQCTGAKCGGGDGCDGKCWGWCDNVEKSCFDRGNGLACVFCYIETNWACSADGTSATADGMDCGIVTIPCSNGCTPASYDDLCLDCTNRACGDDGSGNPVACGACPSGKACDPVSHTCVCAPQCAGKACGADDGCGGKCWGWCDNPEKNCFDRGNGLACVYCFLDSNWACSADGKSATAEGMDCGLITIPCSNGCTPAPYNDLCLDCTNRLCGDDGSGDPDACGSCGSGLMCHWASHTCVCTPQCVGKACGADDGCGGACYGWCDLPTDVCTEGQCKGCGPLDYGSCCGGPAYGGDMVCHSVSACPGLNLPCSNGCTSGTGAPTCLDCTSRECGDDGSGNPDACGTCPTPAVCTAHGACETSCQPECGGTFGDPVRECGPDGCGDVCGICGGAKPSCNLGTGKCEASCTPRDHKGCCGFDLCWVDSCGVVGETAEVCYPGLCDTSGGTPVCRTCVLNCPADYCGSDGCDGTCACTGGKVCNPETDVCEGGTCTPACGGSNPLIPGGGYTCGVDDGCFGTCQCPAGYRCNDTTHECHACSCSGKACGADDGCGSPCVGTCPSGQVCLASTHACCTPQCAGKACGAADTCGGTCEGTCPSGQVCDTTLHACEAFLTDCERFLECALPCGTNASCLLACYTPNQVGGQKAQALGTCVQGQCGAVPAQACYDTAVAGPCKTQYDACHVCTPSCSGKTCGDDGCAGQCPPGCGGGDVCFDGACCTPASCSGKQCGTDGCGTSCGTCPSGQTCQTDRTCTSCTANATVGCCTGGPDASPSPSPFFLPAPPTSGNAVCAYDSCGNPGAVVKACTTTGCTTAEKIVCDGCTANCTLGNTCGASGCGFVCGVCPKGQICDVTLQGTGTCKTPM